MIQGLFFQGWEPEYQKATKQLKNPSLARGRGSSWAAQEEETDTDAGPADSV